MSKNKIYTPRKSSTPATTVDKFLHAGEDEDSMRKFKAAFRSKEAYKNAIGDVPDTRLAPKHGATYMKNSLDNMGLVQSLRMIPNLKSAPNKHCFPDLSTSEKYEAADEKDSYLSSTRNDLAKSDNDDKLDTDDDGERTESTNEDEVVVSTTRYKSSFELDKKPSNMLMSRSQGKPLNASAATLLQDTHIDYITLLGLTLGLCTSKMLHYLLISLAWTVRQIYQLRQNFLDDISVMQYFQYEDTSSLNLKTKICLLPIMAAGWLFYIGVTILQYVTRLFLTQVPDFLLTIVHNLFREI